MTPPVQNIARDYQIAIRTQAKARGSANCSQPLSKPIAICSNEPIRKGNHQIGGFGSGGSSERGSN
jgi:hypothetical protein